MCLHRKCLHRKSPERPRRHLLPDTPGLMGQPGTPLVLPPPDPDPADALPRQWTDYLREQRLVNANYSRRDTEELRTLLIACDRPPAADTADRRFLRDRLKLYLVVAHRGCVVARSPSPARLGARPALSVTACSSSTGNSGSAAYGASSSSAAVCSISGSSSRRRKPAATSSQPAA